MDALMSMVMGVVNQASDLLAQASGLVQGLLSGLGI
ncbi:MAG: hypothetical protein QOF58_4283 [Pseudonocardiales bacterium]|jgi:hypothetical protein|nr:hypothetical protein [Pseudonocardiales bacterium]